MRSVVHRQCMQLINISIVTKGRIWHELFRRFFTFWKISTANLRKFQFKSLQYLSAFTSDCYCVFSCRKLRQKVTSQHRVNANQLYQSSAGIMLILSIYHLLCRDGKGAEFIGIKQTNKQTYRQTDRQTLNFIISRG